MRRTVRSMATALALGFAVYFAARAVWWVAQPTTPQLLLGGVALYLAAVLVAVLSGPGTESRMPLSAAILSLIAGLLVPVLASVALEPAMRGAPFATWYIGAIGLLAVTCIARRRILFGWGILLVLAVESCLFMGIGSALELGLIGSVTWVIVAQLLVLSWDRAVRDTTRLADIQQAVSAWHATQLVRQRERRVRAQTALAAAGPVLSRTVATGGVLTDEERREARLAEGLLRDELRGAVLLNDAVREAIRRVRLRGATVTVFDEGGLDGMDLQRLEEIRDELAEVLSGATSNRVIIRAGRDEDMAVTVVGRAAGGAHDDDAVDLWHEIPRTRPADRS